MAHFLFVFEEGSKKPEVEPVELPSLKAAKEQAVAVASATLKDLDGAFWQDSHWRLEVRDDSGLVLVAIEIDGVQSPAARQSQT